jgi:hypothetical protein
MRQISYKVTHYQLKNRAVVDRSGNLGALEETNAALQSGRIEDPKQKKSRSIGTYMDT